MPHRAAFWRGVEHAQVRAAAAPGIVCFARLSHQAAKRPPGRGEAHSGPLARTDAQGAQLKHRGSRSEAFFASYEDWQAWRGSSLPVPPVLESLTVDLWELYCVVVRLDGPDPARRSALRWPRVLQRYMAESLLSGRAMRLRWGAFADTPAFLLRAQKLRELYTHYLLPYEQDARAAPAAADRIQAEAQILDFGYGTGRMQTLATFCGKAHALAERYELTGWCARDGRAKCALSISLGTRVHGSSLEDLERLYWTLVESPDARLEAEYGNDLSGVCESEFVCVY